MQVEPIITMDEYRSRRQKLMTMLQPNSIVIIPSAPEYQRNWDNPYPYRQNNDFYYLTGFNEPKSVAVLFDDQFWLFNRPRDLAQERWLGLRAGQEGAKKKYQATYAYDIHELEQQLPELFKNREILYFAFGRQMHWDRVIHRLVNNLRGKTRQGFCAPHMIINPEIFLHEMRLVKSKAEIKTMKVAAEISANAHIKAMQCCKPGKYEFELQAVMMEEFMRCGSLSSAYAPIIGSGKNSCILHYSENNQKIQQGDMVLIDAGCEYQNYASDITRTFPANGKFSAEQKAVYEIVLRAQQNAIDLIKPGLVWSAIQDEIVRVMTEGLRDIGLLKGSFDHLLSEKAYLKFYMHSSGHWLGLDTHDVGNYKIANEWRPLLPNMVLTVEPGIYISPDDNIDERFWNIGVRIEDDVVVTEINHEVLSQSVPKKIEAIENLMN